MTNDAIDDPFLVMPADPEVVNLRLLDSTHRDWMPVHYHAKSLPPATQ